MSDNGLAHDGIVVPGRIPDKKSSGGTRPDGRMPGEVRSIAIEAGVLNNADGSASVEWGNNKVLAAVYGPREVHPKYLQNPTKAIIQVSYNMAAFSVEDRARPGPNRRSTEISKIIGEALERAVLTNHYPRTSIDVYIEVLEANGGTRCAGLTAASVALADAGIPMKGLIAACAAGKADDTVVLDLGKEEDNFGQADLPVGYLAQTDEIVLLQMDGHLTKAEFEQAFGMARDACLKILEIQKDALVRRYAVKPPGVIP